MTAEVPLPLSAAAANRASMTGDAELLDGWAAWMALSGLAENTVRARTIHLRAFARSHGPLDQATRTDVARRLGRYSGPVSRSTYASYLRTFYEWANAEGYIADNPTDRLPKMKMPRKAPRPIPPDELARALGIAPERERLWLELMAYARPAVLRGGRSPRGELLAGRRRVLVAPGATQLRRRGAPDLRRDGRDVPIALRHQAVRGMARTCRRLRSIGRTLHKPGMTRLTFGVQAGLFTRR